MRYRTLDLDLIDPDPNQARKKFIDIVALADSIQETGLGQPLIVKKKGERFELLAGERRWRALNLLVQKRGLTEFARVRCQVRTVAETEGGKGTAMGLAENLCRDDLHIIEAARATENALEDRAWTPARLGKAIGRSKGWISAHRQIARGLHADLAAELLKTKAAIPWRILYDASRHKTSDGEPDLERQRRHLEGPGGGRQKNGTKAKFSPKLIRDRAKRLARSNKFPANVRKHIPEIADLLLGAQNP